MKLSTLRLATLALLLLGMTLTVANNGGTASNTDAVEVTKTASMVEGVVGIPVDMPLTIPPPAEMTASGPQPRRTETLPMQVVFNPSTCPNPWDWDNDMNPDANLLAWPAGSQDAMRYAAQIWSSVLNGNVPVIVEVCWYDRLPRAGLLAQAGASTSPVNFPNAPQENTAYPAALANQLANQDVNGSTSEIRASFTVPPTAGPARGNWYFGIDQQVPMRQYDFVSVALHEIGHGLGFAGNDNWSGTCTPPGNSTGSIGLPPTVYDRFTEWDSTLPNGQTTTFDLLALQNPSTALGGALTSDSLFFGGNSAAAGNGGVRPAIHAPCPWVGGTSYDHLHDTFNLTVNDLMTPSFGFRESVHHPGPVALGILEDLGWSVNYRGVVYVDRNGPLSFQDGSQAFPFLHVREGTQAVADRGLVWIAAADYLENLTLSRPMTLASANGTVRIGKDK